MHRPTVQFRLEGQEDLLFELYGFGYQLRDGDLFSYTATGASKVEYKVESAKLDLSEVSVGAGPPRDAWDEPILRIGISVVP